VTVVRTGLLYGPRDTVSFGRLCTLIQKRKMRLIGSGRNHLPLVYVRDVAEAMVLASESPQTIGRTYNLVNDEPVTQDDYLSDIFRELGVDPPHRHVPYRVALMIAAVAETLAHLSPSQGSPPVTRFGVSLIGGENLFKIDRARQEFGFSPR